jgi:hypothetical protein
MRGVGVAATNAKKTHCPQGHAYDESNTEHRANGRRRCRACNRGEFAYYARKGKARQREAVYA